MEDDDQIPAPAENTEAITGEVIPPKYPNLRPPWRKGESGNRGGRPSTRMLTDALSKQLTKRIVPETLKELQTRSPSITKVLGKAPRSVDLLAWSIIQQGIKGNGMAVSKIFDRIEGRLPRDTGGLMPDDDKLDELLDALMTPPAAPGEVNE